MPYSINALPLDFPFPQYYVLAEIGTGGHQLYVKERWHGVCPESDYADAGGRNADGSVGEYWQMGCLMPGCDYVRGTVFTTTDLIKELTAGRVVGINYNGLIIGGIAI